MPSQAKGLREPLRPIMLRICDDEESTAIVAACRLAGYPQTTVPSGQWGLTDAQQWTSGLLASYFWQMSALAGRQASSALLWRTVGLLMCLEQYEVISTCGDVCKPYFHAMHAWVSVVL